MPKSILITGSTDGIGFETAKLLLQKGHHVLLHGRGAQKLINVERELSEIGSVESFLADLSNFEAVKSMARTIKKRHKSLDVLINNAGVFRTPNEVDENGLDIRFAVNAIAPYLLTNELLTLLGQSSRVVNITSAAQKSVDIDALTGKKTGLKAMDAYAQSKLALIMWTRAVAETEKGEGPMMVAVNPGSMLGSKMVREGFGVDGNDIRIGADVLVRASLSPEFANAFGKYFDNDSGQFSEPFHDALDTKKCFEIEAAIKQILSE